MKKYKAIFFDWDGTAVVSRTAPADKVLPLMQKLMEQDTKLIIISGTTYDNIAEGKLHQLIPQRLQKNLCLGLGRGAYNYGFENGNPIILKSIMPNLNEKLKIHEICFEIHKYLLAQHDYQTDIVFSRPNYCKIDLLVDLDRKGKLFLQPGELDLVSSKLKNHGYEEGIKGLMDYSVKLGENGGIEIKSTTDAKYLEVGMSTKSDNVDYLLEEAVLREGIELEECCFWGDEFTYFGNGILGSDAYMITEKTKDAEFFDVSEQPLGLPEQVKHIGGGVKAFLDFIEGQAV